MKNRGEPYTTHERVNYRIFEIHPGGNAGRRSRRQQKRFEDKLHGIMKAMLDAGKALTASIEPTREQFITELHTPPPIFDLLKGP